MERINTIDLRLPDISEINKQDNEDLFALLVQMKNIKKIDNQVIESDIEKDLYPRVRFIKEPLSYPQVSFVTTGKNISKSWQAGDLKFGFNLSSKNEKDQIQKSYKTKLLKDQAGEYTEVEVDSNKYYVLTPGQLWARFDGKLRELDHAGVNFGPKFFDKGEYLKFRNLISERCNLYKYPTGEEWPFIIPSTNAEFKSDIVDESVSRNPKFEFVYYRDQNKPLIQLDINTNLTKDEVLKLLPDPYGISFDDLGEYFRTVFIHISWNDVILRCDLGFRSSTKDFGYWMVKDGGRII